MAESREELVLALERAREAEEDRARLMQRHHSPGERRRYRDALDAMHAAQDRLQQWDEEHYGEDS